MTTTEILDAYAKALRESRIADAVALYEGHPVLRDQLAEVAKRRELALYEQPVRRYVDVTKGAA